MLLEIATANLLGVITDKAGTNHDVGFPSLIAPGLRRNLFSFFDATTRGIKTVIETGNSPLERTDIIVPPKQRKEDMGVFSFQVKRG